MLQHIHMPLYNVTENKTRGKKDYNGVSKKGDKMLHSDLFWENKILDFFLQSIIYTEMVHTADDDDYLFEDSRKAWLIKLFSLKYIYNIQISTHMTFIYMYKNYYKLKKEKKRKKAEILSDGRQGGVYPTQSILYGCWWSGDAGSQGISIHGTDLVHLTYSSLLIRRM